MAARVPVQAVPVRVIRGCRTATEAGCRGIAPLVTVRVLDDVPPLRCGRFVRAFRESACAQRPGFRVVHYSIQDDHAHFLVEAQGKVCLANGMKSLAARFARCVKRVFRIPPVTAWCSLPCVRL